MDLDPTQERELAFLRSQRSTRAGSRLGALATVLVAGLTAGGAAALAASQEHQPWLPWCLASGLGGLLLAGLAVLLRGSVSDETLVRWTVPSDRAARDGGRAVQRAGIRNRPPGETPVPGYWDGWR